MKLLATYNVWDAWELLEGSIRQIREHVDGVLVVYQVTSNYGESDDSAAYEVERLLENGLVDEISLADTRFYNLPAAKQETMKRQAGINYARENGFTHFIHLDCDEYYHTEEFAQAKAYIDYESIDGSVCKIQTYYKRPTLKFHDLDSYYVPFIHRVKPNTTTGYARYPFYADPTRRIGPVKNVIEIDSGMCTMHHFSYIRSDIEKKLRNSTARKNFDIPAIIEEYNVADVGSVISHYDGGKMRLVETPNAFGITIRGDGKEEENPNFDTVSE